MKLYAVILVLFLLMNVGCLENSNTSDTDMDPDIETSTKVDTETDVSPSSGCGLPPIVGGEKDISAGDLIRTYLLDIPSDYDADQPYLLVFAFHGMGMSGNSFRQYCGLTEAIGNEAIIVFPDALGTLPAWQLSSDRDLLFFDALVEYLSNQLCIDQTRIFAAGHSNGASFSNTLGCSRGNVLRAIAPVAGRAVDFIEENSCIGQVAVWLAHGENDLIVPFNMGVEARNYWMSENGCTDSNISVYPDSCVEYTGCDDEYPVRWCTHTRYHRWPDFAAEGIRDFFRSF